jgi:hypothetical protein
MSKLRNFIRYSETTKQVIPNSLVRVMHEPRSTGIWLEIPKNACCDPDNEVGEITPGKSKLKAWMILSKTGDILSGPILRVKQPKNVSVIAVKFDLCCDESTAD